MVRGLVSADFCVPHCMSKTMLCLAYSCPKGILILNDTSLGYSTINRTLAVRYIKDISLQIRRQEDYVHYVSLDEVLDLKLEV
ncbi:hypothetical protein HNY73_003310 [Argiope bruennichi]|uniref:Uncharacterized protein n=1 Tax=Argiope bruennichi TaxID=94029 RepID=A0A8T0FYX2_ARGBR|nr:hypothetical protein HNY73_003310 [Argiope bruennichi]